MRILLRIAILCGAAALVVFVGLRELPATGASRLAIFPDSPGLDERPRRAPTIRVLLADREGPLSLTVGGAHTLRVVTEDGRTKPGGGYKPLRIEVEATATGVRVGRDRYRQMEITPAAGARLSLTLPGRNGPRTQHFTQRLRFMRSKNGRLRVIAMLNLEAYLVGVLTGEMPLNWPPEALKAQAVASRTYAYYRIRTRQGEDYDVTRDVRSQVWKAEAHPEPRAVMAVNATRGIILTERFRLFPCYFHSSCGGRTAAAKHVWPGAEDMTALSGAIEPCPHCAHEPRSIQWSRRYTYGELTAALRRAGHVGGHVQSVRLLNEKGDPLVGRGRVYKIAIGLRGGGETVISADAFRKAFGTGKGEFESTWIWAHPVEGGVRFDGLGWGHGVGLCQHGAKYLAERGYGMVDILRRYYPGVTLVRLWDMP